MNSDPIKELLLRKKSLYEQLLVLFQQQTEISFTENPLEYHSIMESKSLCIEEITKNEIILKRTIYDDSTGEYQELYNMNNTGLREILEEIQRFNEISQKTLQQEQQAVQKRITAIQIGKKGTAGYNSLQKVSVSGAFTDKRR